MNCRSSESGSARRSITVGDKGYTLAIDRPQQADRPETNKIPSTTFPAQPRPGRRRPLPSRDDRNVAVGLSFGCIAETPLAAHDADGAVGTDLPGVMASRPTGTTRGRDAPPPTVASGPPAADADVG
jgi:hypothetical protein